MLFERAAIPSTTRVDPDLLSNGSFEKFTQEITEQGLRLGPCAVRWLEALTISPDATYLSEAWSNDFVDVVVDVAIVYEQDLLERVKALFNDGSFESVDTIPLIEIEVISPF